MDDDIRTLEVFGGYRVHIGSPEGVPGNPDNDMGLMGQERDRPAPGGLVRPHIGLIGGKGRRGREKERGAPPPLLVLFGLLPCGGRATPLWASVPPSYGP